MTQNGTDILLLVNTGTEVVPVYEVVGSQRDVTFDETNDEIDLSNKDSGRAKIVIPGRYSSSISLDALYVPTNDAYLALKDACRDGELILVARTEDDVTTEIASAMIATMSSGFPDQGESTISITFTVSGEWDEVGS